ncbi:hypothetical protein BC830DRAFT_250002 [Chytriomyces sp. MP71]|nr:hypothetical protein BC830DRAFT_250002 [Chytriomyces sp. MP71]
MRKEKPNHKNRKPSRIMKLEGLLGPMIKSDQTSSASGRVLERQNTVHDDFDLQEQHEPKTVLVQKDKFVTYLKRLSDDSETEPNVDYCNDFDVLFARYQTEVNGRELFHRKVRSSSFVNVFGRIKVLSFEDWLKAFEQEKILGMEGNSVSGSMKFRKAVSPHNSTTIKIESPTSPDSKKLYYIAEYLASDDDFLMKSSVRANFRENALESDDAVLFTLVGTGGATEQHPTLRDFVYSFEDGTGWCITSKSFKLFLFSYFTFSVVIVNFFGECQLTSFICI